MADTPPEFKLRLYDPNACKGIILHLEDDPELRGTTKRYLERKDYQVIPAENVAEAIDLLEKEDIDVILSDHQLESGTSAKLLSFAKKNYPDLPVILNSGTEVERIQETYEAYNKQLKHASKDEQEYFAPIGVRDVKLVAKGGGLSSLVEEVEQTCNSGKSR